MKPTDVPYTKPELSENYERKKCVMPACQKYIKVSDGWKTRNGFICNKCQKALQMKATSRKDSRKIAFVVNSSFAAIPEGQDYQLDYVPGALVGQLYKDDKMSYTVDRAHAKSTRWYVNGGSFRVELEEV